MSKALDSIQLNQSNEQGSLTVADWGIDLGSSSALNVNTSFESEFSKGSTAEKNLPAMFLVDSSDEEAGEEVQDDLSLKPSNPDKPRGETSQAESGYQRPENINAQQAPLQPYGTTSQFRSDGTLASMTKETNREISRIQFYSQQDLAAAGIHDNFPRRSEISSINPDGSSEYIRYSPDGNATLVQRYGNDGSVSTLTRQDDGTYQETFRSPDGTSGSGVFDSQLAPVVTVRNLPDGSQITERISPGGNMLERSTRYADGSHQNFQNIEGYGQITEHYAPNGTNTGSFFVPAVPRSQNEMN